MSGTQASAGTATGAFRIANGQIIDPGGFTFVARGINVGPQDMVTVAQSLTTTFPGANFIRLATWDTAPYSLSDYQNFISQMTAKGIVVEIEDHAYPSPGTYTGSQLTAESNWYVSLASAFVNNPYVWFGTMNEPNSGTYGPSEAAITTQEVATYNAIRGVGNNSMIMMELDGGGNPGSIGADFGMTASAYTSMTNIAWDLHYYGWASNYSTDQATVTADLLGSASGGYGIAAAQTITSADGIVPTIVGEFGDSTNGSSVDPNGTQVVSAVVNSGYGFAAWTWGGYGGPDSLTQNGSLTSLGQQVAKGIANGAGATGNPTPTPIPTPSPYSNEITTTSGGTLTDSAGNKWTLTSAGVINENGTAVPDGSGTSAVALASNVIYGQDATTKSWYAYSTTSKTWTSSAAPVLTTTPTPTPTPAPTTTPTATVGEVTRTSGGTLIDTAGNKWTLSSTGVVNQNGTAIPGGSGTAALALVSNVIYGQDATTKSWYAYS
jgi:cellulase (glycosyl hydrolase family 5)